jgi:phosphoserine phosphatase RsbU/P
MLPLVFQPILHEYRTRRMARFTILVLLYGAALLVAKWLSSHPPVLWWFIFWVALLISCLYYLARLIGFVRQRLLWRLRWRLIVTYVFMAFVPILLIVLLGVIGAFIINGQFAAYLVNLRLRSHAENLAQLNRVVIHEVHQSAPEDARKLLDGLKAFFVTELSEHAASYPHLEVTLRIGSNSRAFRLDGSEIVEPVTVPEWFKQDEFSGFVLDRGKIDLRSIARTKTPEGDLVAVLSQPMTPELLDLVAAGIGPAGVFVPERRAAATAQGGAANLSREPGPPGGNAPVMTVSSKSVPLPERASLFDYKVFGASTMGPIQWEGTREEAAPDPVFIYAYSRIVTLNRQLFVTLGQYSQIYVTVFVVVAVIFLVLEGIALIVGVRLTRSMTTTVDNLYDATEKVKAGDLSYRINVRANDQLSALGEAFDNMTASVERLLKESQVKLRLESELEIAREVQTQLFPRAIPSVEGLELFGVCQPASGVSGDYYDFLDLGKNCAGLVLGDVSGKGISAALLMAAIQSSLHAQFYDGRSSAALEDSGPPRAAEVVSRLNAQLYESTTLEKYATFFYAVYDARTRKLTYTNAGHLAPALFRRGSIERLSEGGTVIGLFAAQEYQQQEIQLEPGDVLLAFTDGVTEPENTFGEEFGEERVLEAAQRALGGTPEAIVEEIYRGVGEWTGSPELQDDMTLIVAKSVE